jgi:hypothetical protein
MIVSLLILRSTSDGSLVICKKVRNIWVFIENVPDYKNLPFTDSARDRHFSVSQSHGMFLPGDQKVLFFLLNKIVISDISFSITQTL